MAKIELAKVIQGFANDNDGQDLLLHTETGILAVLLNEGVGDPMKVEVVRSYKGFGPGDKEMELAMHDFESFYKNEMGR